MNISSIVVRTKAEEFEHVKKLISEIQNCEIYLSDKESSHIIVVLEAKDIQEEVAINKHIESLAGVISAQMHYTYQEDELNATLQKMHDGACEFLNDESISAEDITYSGSIAHLMGKTKPKDKQ